LEEEEVLREHERLAEPLASAQAGFGGAAGLEEGPEGGGGCSVLFGAVVDPSGGL